jgi:hypothetical protein
MSDPSINIILYLYIKQSIKSQRLKFWAKPLAGEKFKTNSSASWRETSYRQVRNIKPLHFTAQLQSVQRKKYIKNHHFVFFKFPHPPPAISSRGDCTTSLPVFRSTIRSRRLCAHCRKPVAVTLLLSRVSHRHPRPRVATSPPAALSLPPPSPPFWGRRRRWQRDHRLRLPALRPLGAAACRISLAVKSFVTERKMKISGRK